MIDCEQLFLSKTKLPTEWCSATIWMEALRRTGWRIASSEMLLDADPLPHLKCCQRRAAGEVRYEADRHDDTR
jgi:hypothetical protein